MPDSAEQRITWRRWYPHRLLRGIGTDMSSNYLFLDTEWADWEGEQLVSLSLISADGHVAFYAERDPLPANPTDFVRETVYPLLDRGSRAKSDLAFVHDLRSLLQSIPHPIVVYDYPTDAALLWAALAGFRLVPSELTDCPPPPRGLEMLLVQDPLVAAILEDWFTANPSEAVRRHHATVDANAFRLAWLAANGRVEAPWSDAWRRRTDLLDSE